MRNFVRIEIAATAREFYFSGFGLGAHIMFSDGRGEREPRAWIASTRSALNFRLGTFRGVLDCRAPALA